MNVTACAPLTIHQSTFISLLIGEFMDHDLEQMSRDQLIAEVQKLRRGIRAHRDRTGHQLCWHHPDLWGLLPEPENPMPTVPDWPQFMRGCIRYRQSLDIQLPGAPRTTREYDELG